MDRYPEGFVKASSYKGAVTGLPMRSHGQLFYYRKDVFDPLGLKPPETWDDVVAAGKAIRAHRTDIEPLALSYHNDGTRQSLFHWCDFIWSSGDEILDAKLRPAWTTDSAIAATEFYVGLLTKKRVANPASGAPVAVSTSMLSLVTVDGLQQVAGLRLDVNLNDDASVTIPVAAQAVCSVPGRAWRTITARGDTPAEIAVMIAGDARKHITWSAAIVAQAAEAGRGMDHNDYLAPKRLLPPTPAMAAE